MGKLNSSLIPCERRTYRERVNPERTDCVMQIEDDFFVHKVVDLLQATKSIENILGTLL